MFDYVLSKILYYNIKINDKNYDSNNDLLMLNYSRASIASKYAIQKSDCLISYGIFNDITFESNYSDYTNNDSYAFDCGVEKIDTLHQKCHFSSECIGNDKFVIKELVSNNRVHQFSDKLKRLNLEDKKLYIKLDIACGEASVLQDILKYSDNITGITLSMCFNRNSRIINRAKLLNYLNENFVLIARTPIYYTEPEEKIYTAEDIKEDNNLLESKYYKGNFYKLGVVDLTYINKNLVDDYTIAWSQNSKNLYNKLHCYSRKNKTFKKFSDNDVRADNVSFVMVFSEKIKEYIRNIKSFLKK